MTLAITLQPELEMRIREEAAREGLTIEQLTTRKLLEAELEYTYHMAESHLQSVPEPTPHGKFVKGLRAVFGTTKAESDKQLAEEAKKRKQERKMPQK
jgi:hypothetical protein